MKSAGSMRAGRQVSTGPVRQFYVGVQEPCFFWWQDERVVLTHHVNIEDDVVSVLGDHMA